MLETDRLLLRKWRDADAEPFARLNADPEVARYLGGPMTREASDAFVAQMRAHWAAHGFGLYAVERRDSGTFIGFIGLAIPSFLPEVLPAVEVGWRLAREQWGQGFATEGAKASVEHAFTALELRQVISIIHPDNAASVRVAERLGMTRDKDRIHPRSRERLSVYVKSAEDAASSPAPS